MSATNSTAKESSNADLIAMLSELDGLSSIEEPDVLKEEVVEVKVSVQREPSGHNLKHPTKWCPPNK
ncbi:TPA: hypothetical protein ACHJGO_003192 [Klebsiella pneumoniae]